MIGVFDSGLGGLTVVRALMESLPDYDIIYFGDTARTPYGTKSSETVIRYALQNTDFLINNGANIIVIACNTASSVATPEVTGKYDIPFFEVITPAVDHSLETTKTNNIGVIGTRATINSGVYERKIKKKRPDAKVYSKPCPLLVPLVEEGWMKKPETKMIIKKYLHPLKVSQVDTLILGCTHYPLLKEAIQSKIGKKVNIIDSALTVAGRVKTYIEANPDIDNLLTKHGKTEFYVSDITQQFKETASTILKRKIHLKQVKI
ncbi:MAG: glutamate racemase [Desulfobacterales bacterium]|jgi:glutamate racemase|nr:glutamate racemase [Desulfobacteraceae bacterium]MBT4363327.1 glutamate racemase [Desulfobacteraceae bacterium]MBT7084655.1 glutamate racemase [Desulfobacterales bacterium]